MSPSKTSSTIRVAAAVLALGAAAPALATAATQAAGPGGLAAADGCGRSCIKSAIITPGVGAAKVAVETSGPATIQVTVRRPSADGRPGPLAYSATSPAGQRSFTTTAEPLQAGTDYDVTVTTKDTGGAVSSRTGRLHTLEAAPLVESAAGDEVAPVDPGCSGECITGSSAVPNLQTAQLSVDTRVPAELVITAARTAPAPTSQGPMFTKPEAKVQTGLGTHWSGKLTKLRENAKYFVVVRATDEQGRTSVRQGSFKTLKRNVQVRFTDIRVTNDAEKGANRGEITFYGEVNGTWTSTRLEDKIGSDTTVHFDKENAVVDLTNAPRTLSLRVQGKERDGGNLCFDSHTWMTGISGYKDVGCGTYEWDTALGEIDLGAEADRAGALPPGYGGGAMFRRRYSDAGRADLNFSVGVDVDVWAG